LNHPSLQSHRMLPPWLRNPKHRHSPHTYPEVLYRSFGSSITLVLDETHWHRINAKVASHVFSLLASVEGTTVCLEIPLQSPLGETVTCPPPPRLCPTPPLRYTGCELHLILRYQLLARCSEYPGGACERPSVLFHEGKLCRQNRPIS